MPEKYDKVFGYNVKIHSSGIIIVVEKKPTSEEASYMTNLICGYLIDEGFFDRTEYIKVEIVRKNK